MIPKFLDDILVKNILQAGKSVNFLRKCCKVNDWMLKLKTIDVEKDNFNSSTIDEIKKWVNSSTEITSKKLIDTMMKKFNFK